MSGNMWKYDPYDIRKFKHGDISTFVDIGSNEGLITLTAVGAWYDGQCRYIMIEPFAPTLERCKVRMGQWPFKLGAEIWNAALGNNETLYFIGGRFHGQYKFLTQKEFDAHVNKNNLDPNDAQVFNTTQEYLKTPVQSYTLPALFEEWEIDVTKEYFLKIDCEGGERFIFDDQAAIDICKQAAQIGMEVHYMSGFTAETFLKFCSQMADTHIVRRTLQIPYDNKLGKKGEIIHLELSPEDIARCVGYGKKVFKTISEATFVRKDWNLKRPTKNCMKFKDAAALESWKPLDRLLNGVVG